MTRRSQGQCQWQTIAGPFPIHNELAFGVAHLQCTVHDHRRATKARMPKGWNGPGRQAARTRIERMAGRRINGYTAHTSRPASTTSPALDADREM